MHVAVAGVGIERAAGYGCRSRCSQRAVIGFGDVAGAHCQESFADRYTGKRWLAQAIVAGQIRSIVGNGDRRGYGFAAGIRTCQRAAGRPTERQRFTIDQTRQYRRAGQRISRATVVGAVCAGQPGDGQGRRHDRTVAVTHQGYGVVVPAVAIIDSDSVQVNSLIVCTCIFVAVRNRRRSHGITSSQRSVE